MYYFLEIGEAPGADSRATRGGQAAGSGEVNENCGKLFLYH